MTSTTQMMDAVEHHEMDDLPLQDHDVTREMQLPPADRGRKAHLIILACSIMQIPVWSFPVSYGVFQEYYSNPDSPLKLSGSISSTGTIGTTLNGIIYISMPVLFGLLTRKLSKYRKHMIVLGGMISIASMIGSAFSTHVSHLIITQGILQGFGATMLYSASTIYIDEWFIQRKGFAYGLTLSTKSAVGVGAPLAFSSSLSRLGYRTTLLIWSGILFFTLLPAPFLLKPRVPISSLTSTSTSRPRTRSYSHHPNKISWSFLRHRTFPTFALTNIIFAASYGIPQTYLSAFASSALHFSLANSALILSALNIPSILASFWFGTISDGERSKIFGGRKLSIDAVSCLSALGACLPIFLLWGMVPTSPVGTSSSENEGNTPAAIGIALLTLFAIFHGFFSGGYSSTWGGVVSQVSKEANEHDESVDTALLYGLMNGGRGVGYILGGLLSVELLKVGSVAAEESMLAYGSGFGALIVFAGCGCAVAGMGVLGVKMWTSWRGRR